MNKRVPCLRRVNYFVALLKDFHGQPFMDITWILPSHHHGSGLVPIEVGSDTLLFGVGALLDLLAAGLCLKYL